MSAPDEEEVRAFLEEAVKDLHKNETFERALGRVLRRHNLGYEVYLDLVSRLRERADREQIGLLEAARSTLMD